MATTLYLRSHTGAAELNWGSGDRYTKMDSGVHDWVEEVLLTSRGSSSSPGISTDTVAAPATGIEVGSTLKYIFVSAPLSADATITGQMTFAAWAMESSMSANVAINYRIMSAGPNGGFTELYKTVRTTECATTSGGAANVWNETPGSFSFNKGDRVVIVPFIDDGGGTMAVGYTANFYYNGPTASAQGDSYVTFNETLSFLSSPSGTTLYLTNDDAGVASGGTGDTGLTSPTSAANVTGPGPGWTDPTNVYSSNNAYASGFTAAQPSDSLRCTGFGFSLPVAALITGVQVVIENYASDVIGLNAQLTVSGLSIGDIKSDSFYTSENTLTLGGTTDKWGATLSKEEVEASDFGVDLTVPAGSGDSYFVDHVQIRVYYAVPHDRLVWTSRGGGVQTDGAGTASGPVPPIQMADTAYGALVEWWTKPLQAFTLSGAVLCHIRMAESSATANGTARVEIARTDYDGTGSTQWASCTPALEPGASETVLEWWLSGDDMVITDGQRLRIRVYIDDYYGSGFTGPLVNGHTITLYYAGAAGATGDTYLTFSQTLTEYVVAAARVPYRSPMLQLLAH